MNKMRPEEIEIVSVEDDKFSIEVEIIGVKDFDVQEITANVIINIKGNKLKCFVSDFEEKGPFFEGDMCDVVLSLMTTELAKTDEIKKEIEKGKKYETHCTLSGEIVDFTPLVSLYYDAIDVYYIRENADYKDGIVDCGIFVAIGMPKDSDLKIEDHIKAGGRLDIKKSRERITINIRGCELKCFVSDFEEKGTFFAGEKYNAILSLLPTILTETSEIKKEIKNAEGYEEYCSLSGKLIEFVPLIEFYCDVKKGSNYIKKNYHYKYGIVDCSVFVAVKIPKGSNLKIGDYIKAVGRLDIRKVK